MSTDSRSEVMAHTSKTAHQKKNVQFSYAEYCGHFCLGIIYTRADKELTVKTIENLRSITSVVKDFLFFACEKWEIAGDRQGSGNTANVGSITFIDDILKGNGIFANLGEQWFDEYWMNYKVTKMMKNRKVTPITCLNDFIKFKHGNVKLINKVVSKTKVTKDPLFVTTITMTTK